MRKVDRVVVAGPLAPFATGFQARLEELGYTPLSTVTWMRLMVHLSRWLGARGLTAADLSSQRVETVPARATGCRLCPFPVVPQRGRSAGVSELDGCAGPRGCAPAVLGVRGAAGLVPGLPAQGTGLHRAPHRPMCCVRTASWTAAVPRWSLSR